MKFWVLVAFIVVLFSQAVASNEADDLDFYCNMVRDGLITDYRSIADKECK